MHQIEIDAHYKGYLERQELDVQAFRRDQVLIIPDDINYESLPGLSTEVSSKLDHARPATLAAAARISGTSLSSDSLINKSSTFLIFSV